MKNCFPPQGVSRRSRRGFTLIEILVVIGIILLLAGLSFPVFNRVREGARTTSCSNNMRQLGLAFRQYMQDYAGRYPGGASFRRWADGGHWVSGVNNQNIADLGSGDSLMPANDCAATSTCYTADVEKGVIFPYVRNKSTYICPSNSQGEVKKLSYSMNCAIQFMGEVRVKNPDEIILLVDEQKANDGYFFAVNKASAYPFNLIVPDAESTDKLSELHNGGGNLLFADGHIKFYPFNTFILDNSDAGFINKGRMTDVPRFHDKAFGPYGSYAPTGQTNDACGVKLS